MSYTTIQDHYINNGNRHLQRANRYLADSNIDFAIGSLKKANKNYTIARILEPDDLTKKICDVLAEQIADDFLNGVK